jgi:transketolase
MAAAHYKLDNLVLMVDWNGLQMDGPVRAVMGVEPIADKFQAFGWKTVPVSDGHDFEDLLIAVEKALEVQRRPSVIIARTVKGKGIPFAEDKASYHAEVLSSEELAEALPKLKSDLIELMSEK